MSTEEEYQTLCPLHGNALPSMAIATIKRDENGKPKRAKYRIVALGNLDTTCDRESCRLRGGSEGSHGGEATRGGVARRVQQLEVARRSERQDAGGGEAGPPVHLVDVPPLQLLPGPGDDAGGLIREDVDDQLLPHPGQASVTGLGVFAPEDGVDPLVARDLSR